MKRLALVTVAAFLLLAGSAGATPFGPAEEVAYAEAKAFWGRTVTGCLSVERELVPPGSLDWPEAGETGILGRTTLVEPGLPYLQHCRMRIVEGLAPDLLCYAIRWEYGHLLGYGDLELAAMPVPRCESASTTNPSATRQQPWDEWRELRNWCRESRGPWRKKCWQRLRAKRLSLIRRQGSFRYPPSG